MDPLSFKDIKISQLHGSPELQLTNYVKMISDYKILKTFRIHDNTVAHTLTIHMA